jgi:repressor LexA
MHAGGEHTNFLNEGLTMADFSQLTQRQKEIYEFIREKIESRGYGPTVREIGLGFAIKSPNGVMCHLKALEKKGLIIRQEFSARAIKLVDHRPPSLGLPLLGNVAAGSPVEALEQQDRLEFGDLFGGPNRFALKVRGQSMIEDHIADGDYVVIHQQETARNGERVVAMIDGEVTLKRYYEEPETIRLEPANGTMKPIVVPKGDAQVLGVLVGVVRKC